MLRMQLFVAARNNRNLVSTTPTYFTKKVDTFEMLFIQRYFVIFCISFIIEISIEAVLFVYNIFYNWFPLDRVLCKIPALCLNPLFDLIILLLNQFTRFVYSSKYLHRSVWFSKRWNNSQWEWIQLLYFLT